MTNLGTHQSSLELNLLGTDKILADLKAIKNTVIAMEQMEIELGAVVPKVPKAGVRKFAKELEAAIQRETKSLNSIEIGVSVTNAAAKLKDELKGIVPENEINALAQKMQQSQMDAKAGIAATLNNMQSVLDIVQRVDVGLSRMQSKFGETEKSAAAMGQLTSLMAQTRVEADKVTSSVTQLVQSVSKTDTSTLARMREELAGIAKEQRSAVVGAPPVSAAPAGGGGGPTANDTAAVSSEMFGLSAAAAVVSGRISEAFKVAMADSKDAMSSAAKSFSDIEIPADVFSKMFSPSLMANVEKLRKGAEDVRLSIAAVEERGVGAKTDTGEYENILRLQTALTETAVARRDVANSMLAVEREIVTSYNDATGATLATLNASNMITEGVSAQKAGISELLGLLSESSSVLQSEAALRARIVNIVKMGGDAEIDEVSRRREIVNLVSEQLTYAQRLQAAAEKLKGSSSFDRDTKQALLTESNAQYRQTASFAEGPALDKALAGVSSTRGALEQSKAWANLRNTVTEVVSAIESGVPTGYRAATTAMLEYAAVSKSGLTADNGNLEAMVKLLAVAQRRYAELKSANSGTDLTERQQLGSFMGAASAVMQQSPDTSMQAKGAGIAVMLEKEQQITAEKIAQSAAVDRIHSEYAKLITLYNAGVNVLGNQAALEKLMLEATKQGVTLEQQLAATTVNKNKLIRDTVQQYGRLKDIIHDTAASESLRLGALKESKTLLEAAQATFQSQPAIKRVRVGEGERTSLKQVTEELAATNALIASLEAVTQQRAADNERATLAANIARQRATDERNLVNALQSMVTLTSENMVGEREYMAMVKLRVQAEKDGVATAVSGATMRAAERQVVSQLVAEETRLAAVMQDSTRTMHERKAAAEAWKSTIASIAQYTQGGKEFVASPAGKDKTRIDDAYVSKRRDEGMGVAADLNMSGVTEKVKEADSAFERIKTSIDAAVQSIEAGKAVLTSYKIIQNGLLELSAQGKDAEVAKYAEQLKGLDVYTKLVNVAKNFAAQEDTIRTTLGATTAGLEQRAALYRARSEASKEAAGHAPDAAARAGNLDDAALSGLQATKLQTSLDLMRELDVATVTLGSNGTVAIGKLADAFNKMMAANGGAAGSAALLRTDEFKNFYTRAAEYIDKSVKVADTAGGRVAAAAKYQAANVADAVSRMFATAFAGVKGGAKEAVSARKQLSDLARHWAELSSVNKVESERLNSAVNLSHAMNNAVLALRQQHDVTNNNKILMDGYVNSVQSGIPVLAEAYSAMQSQEGALAALYTEVTRINAELEKGNLTEQQRLALYGRQKNLLGEMVKYRDVLANGVKIGEKTITSQEISKQHMQSASSAAALQSPGTETKSLAAAQLAEIRKGAAAQDKISADILKAQESDMQSLLGQAQQLKTVTLDTTRSNVERREAMTAMADTLTRMRDVIPIGGLNIDGVQVTVETLNTALNRVAKYREKFNEAMKAGLELPADKSLLTIGSALTQSTTAGTDQVAAGKMKAELEDQYAQAVLRSRTALLSGVSPLENYVRLHQAVNDAAANGVAIDRESLALLDNKAKVMSLIAAQVKNSVSVGTRTSDPYTAAAQVTSARSGINMLEQLGMGKEQLAELQTSLEPIIAKAGAALKGSFAEARKEADMLRESTQTLFANMQYAGDGAKDLGTAYEANAVYVQRIIENVKRWGEAESKILRNHEFLGKMTADEINSQQKQLAIVERFQQVMASIGKEHDKAQSSLSKIGNFSVSDASTPEGAKNISTAAMNSGQSKEYLKFNESMKNMQGLVKVTQDLISKNPILASTLGPVVGGLKSVGDAARAAETEVSKYARAHEKASSNDAGASIMDKFRVMWFAQLRAFWALYTNMQQAAQNAIEYNHTLNVMQAVTQGTTRDIGRMNMEFRNLAREVPLALAGVSKAALEVSKAGFGVEDTMKIIQASAKLAYASQSEIAKVADLQSVIIHAWGKSADEADTIADKLFNAVAKSRADINGLADAIGYVAGIAPQANVTLETALSMMSILTNAGLTMSKAGTYMRQFINDLMNPSEKFVQILGSMGIKVAEVDPRLNNMASIFQRLSSAGMNAADAFEGMSIRAASAFSIMLNNAGMIDDYHQMISETGTVLQAYDKSIRDVASAWQLLANSGQELFVALGDVLGPTTQKILLSAKSLVDVLVGLVSLLSAGGDSTGEIISQFLLFAGGAATVYMALSKVTAGMEGASKSSSLLVTAVSGLQSLGTKSGPLGLLGRIIFGPLGAASIGKIALAATTIGVLFAAVGTIIRATGDDMSDVLDKQKKLAESTDKMKGIAAEEVKQRVNIAESRAIGGKSASYAKDMRAANLNAPIERDFAGMGVRGIAGALRQSTVSEVQAIGEEISRINISALDSADAAAEKMAKVMALYEKAANLLTKVPDGLKENLADQRKNLERINGLIDQLNKARANLVEQPKGEGITDTITEAMRKFNKESLRLATNPLGGREGEREYDPKAYAKNALERFDVSRTGSGADVGSRALHELTSSNMGSAGLGGIGKLRESIAGVVESMVAGITRAEVTWDRATNDLEALLKSLGMSLSNEEKAFLSSAITMEGYTESLRKVIAAKKEQVAAMDLKGLGDDPAKINSFIAGVTKMAQAYSGLMESGSGDLDTLNTLTKMRDSLQASLKTGTDTGIITEKVNPDLYAALNRLIEGYAKAEAQIRKNHAENVRAMNEDSNKILSEDITKKNKELIDTFKKQVEQVTNKARSVSETSKFAVMIDMPGLQTDIDTAQAKVLEMVGETMAQYAKLSRTAGVNFMEYPEVLKSFNKAVRGAFDAYVGGLDSSSGDVVDSILNAAETLRAQFKKYAGENNIDYDLNVSDIIRATGAGEKILNDFRNRSKDSIYDSYSSVADGVKRLFDDLQKLSGKGLSGAEIMGISEASFQQFNKFVKINKEVRNSVLENQKVLATYSTSMQLFNVAVEGLSNLSSAATMNMEFTESLAKSEKQLTDLRGTLRTAADAVRQWKVIMAATVNQGEGSMLNVQEMQTAAEALKSGINSSASAVDTLASSIKKLRDEMKSLKMASVKSQLDYTSKVRDAKLSNTALGQNPYYTGQVGLNDKRESIAATAQYMSTEELRSSLTDLRDSLVAFYQQFPYDAAGGAALSESSAVQEQLKALYQSEYQTKAAEAATAQAFQQVLKANTDEMVSQLQQINGILARIESSSAAPTMPTLANDPLAARRAGNTLGGVTASGKKVSADIGGLAAPYESGTAGSLAVSKDPNDKGGTSYGKYQFSSRLGTMDAFVKFLGSFDQQLLGELNANLKLGKAREGRPETAPNKWDNNGIGAEVKAWKDVAAAFPEKLAAAEKQFMLNTHYSPAMAETKKRTGVDFEDESINPAFRQMMFSTATQHGPRGAASIFDSALKSNEGKVDEALISKIYEQRLEQGFKNQPMQYDNQRRRYMKESSAAMQAYQDKDAERKAGIAAADGTPTVASTDAALTASKEVVASLSTVVEAIQKIAEGSATQEGVAASMTPEQNAEIAAVAAGTKTTEDIVRTVAQTQADIVRLEAERAALAKAEASAPKATAEPTAPETAKVAADLAKTATEVKKSTAEINASATEYNTQLSGVAATSTAAAEASDKYKQAVAAEAAAKGAAQSTMSAASKTAGGRRPENPIRDYHTMPQVMSDLARDNYREPNKLAYETFSTQVGQLKAGMASAASAALRDVISGDATAEEVIENLSWQIIDTWIGGLTDSLMSGVTAWLAGGKEGPMAGLTQFLGFGPQQPSQQPALGVGVPGMAGAAPGVPGAVPGMPGVPGMAGDMGESGNIAKEGANLAVEATNLAQDTANLTQDAANMAQDTANLAQTSANMAQEGVNLTQEQTAASTLNSAGTALSSAASALSSAASALSSAAAADSAAGAAGGGAKMGGMGSMGGVQAALGGMSFMFNEGGFVCRHEGGEIPGFDGGGVVTRGNRQKDSTIAALTKGEFVLQEPAVRKYGLSFMHKLNQGKTADIARMVPRTETAAVSYDPGTFTPLGGQSAPAGPSSPSAQAGQGGVTAGTDKGVHLTSINVSDPRDIERYLSSQRGSKVVMNLIAQGQQRQMRRNS